MALACRVVDTGPRGDRLRERRGRMEWPTRNRVAARDPYRHGRWPGPSGCVGLGRPDGTFDGRKLDHRWRPSGSSAARSSDGRCSTIAFSGSIGVTPDVLPRDHRPRPAITMAETSASWSVDEAIGRLTHRLAESSRPRMLSTDVALSTRLLRSPRERLAGDAATGPGLLGGLAWADRRLTGLLRRGDRADRRSSRRRRAAGSRG